MAVRRDRVVLAGSLAGRSSLDRAGAGGAGSPRTGPAAESAAKQSRCRRGFVDRIASRATGIEHDALVSSAFSFWQQLLLNLVGPAVTVVVGTVAVGGLVSWLQRRRESRLDRQDLTVEMFRVAYGFYIPVEDARRQGRYKEPAELGALDYAFQEFRVAGRTIESRLRVPEQGREQVASRWVWHCVLDLLTLLYFHHRHPGERTTDMIANQKKEHVLTNTREEISEVLIQRYLRPEGLDQADEVKRRFAEALDELIALRR